MRVARSTLRRSACNEKEPRTKRYNVRRQSLFRDRKREAGMSLQKCLSLSEPVYTNPETNWGWPSRSSVNCGITFGEG